MFTCPNGHTEFEVYPVGISDGIGIIVYPNGNVSNRWADGTVGVPANMKELAYEESEAVCATCGTHVTWEAK